MNTFSNINYLQNYLENGGDPNVIDHNNYTILHHTNDTNIIKLLLQHNADPNILTRFGILPIHTKKSVENLKILLPVIQNINHVDNFGCMPLDYQHNFDTSMMLLKNGAKYDHIINTNNVNNELKKAVHSYNCFAKGIAKKRQRKIVRTIHTIGRKNILNKELVLLPESSFFPGGIEYQESKNRYETNAIKIK